MRIAILLFFVFCLACKKNVAEEKTDTTGNDVKAEILDTSTITKYVGTKIDSNNGFDKSKWMMKDDHHYPYRDEMLAGLLSSYKLDSLNKDEILDLLGEPNRIDNNYLFYVIAQKRLGFWPLHTKTLVIKFADESRIEWIRIHE